MKDPLPIHLRERDTHTHTHTDHLHPRELFNTPLFIHTHPLPQSKHTVTPVVNSDADKSVVDAEERSAERGRKGALILSILTLVISIPAVVGA